MRNPKIICSLTDLNVVLGVRAGRYISVYTRRSTAVNSPIFGLHRLHTGHNGNDQLGKCYIVSRINLSSIISPTLIYLFGILQNAFQQQNSFWTLYFDMSFHWSNIFSVSLPQENYVQLLCLVKQYNRNEKNELAHNTDVYVTYF